MLLKNVYLFVQKTIIPFKKKKKMEKREKVI